MERTLAQVAEAVQGRLIGADARFGAVSTDTRTLEKGALFVAIVGERHDGNRFVGDAAAKGAAGAMVSVRSDVALPQIEVDDTRVALGRMAHAWRASFRIPVIAVTAFAMKGDEERIREGGCEAYLSKPISVAKFLETVRNYLDAA